MAVVVYLSPITPLLAQVFSNAGIVSSGAKVFTYQAGTVNTPQTTYSDSTGTVANPNPMTLSAAGRPVSASGAPVSFWQPSASAIKVVVTDAAGNVLIGPIDNIAGIGDLSFSNGALQSLLANPASSNAAGAGPAGGVDYVANAVKSYDVFASVRAANVPLLIAGQTWLIITEGGSTVGDLLGGVFYWSTTSSATDDGRNVLKPSSVNPIAGGRYLRLFPLGVPVMTLKTVDQQVVSSTTLVQDTQLVTAAPLAGVYRVECKLQLSGSGGTAQGYKVALNTNNVTGNLSGVGVGTGNGTAVVVAPVVGVPVTNAALSSTNGDMLSMEFILTFAALGSIAISFAQNSSSANPTILKAGSCLIVTRIG